MKKINYIKKMVESRDLLEKGFSRELFEKFLCILISFMKHKEAGT
ncbi:hypothetical protein ABH966_002214 [Lysinibacillus sp. RC46]